MRILVLGGGWLGHAFARSCVEKGDEVWATTTTADKLSVWREQGIQGVLLTFGDETLPTLQLPERFDFVLNSIPSTKSLTAEENKKRFEKVSGFLRELQYTKHIYLSSIGIYPEEEGVYDERVAGGSLRPGLYLAEQMMQSLSRTYVFRLGGLFGEQRIFAKYFANRACATGDEPANFIHQDDVLNLLHLGFENALMHPVYNLVCPEHPLKKEVIVASAKKYKYALPTEFLERKGVYKIVKGERIQQELNYDFVYPSPLDF